MPPDHKQAFYEAINQGPLIHFKQVECEGNAPGGIIVKVHTNRTAMVLAYNLSREKALHTMSSNQNLQEREFETKVAKLCRGIIGEMAIQIFLSTQLERPISDVLRYDLERLSFQYSPIEYDLSLNEMRIEVRTSNNPYSTLKEYLNSSDRGVICRYINTKKVSERSADYYFAVVYDYPDQKGRTSELQEKAFMKDLLHGSLHMYIIAGVSEQERLASEKIVSLGQYKTSYGVVPFKSCRLLQYVVEELGQRAVNE